MFRNLREVLRLGPTRRSRRQIRETTTSSTDSELTRDQTCTVQVYNPLERPWNTIAEEVVALERKVFGIEALTPFSLSLGFVEPDSVAVLLTDTNNHIVGFTYAENAIKAYARNRSFYVHELKRNPTEDTAYISDIAIHPDFQKQHHTPQMMSVLKEGLKARGYNFIEIDAAIDNGYADNVERNETQHIIEKHDHDSSIGRQRFFRMRL